jgi:hypothetical protein
MSSPAFRRHGGRTFVDPRPAIGHLHTYEWLLGQDLEKMAPAGLLHDPSGPRKKNDGVMEYSDLGLSRQRANTARRIRTRFVRETNFEKAGFKSWSKYCGAGRVEYGKRHADKLIRASELRSKIGPREAQFSWRQMVELAKCETDNDARCSFKLLF